MRLSEAILECRRLKQLPPDVLDATLLQRVILVGDRAYLVNDRMGCKPV